MEVKLLSLRQRPPELRLPLFQSKFNFPSYSEKFLRNRIRGTVKKWRLRLLEMSTCQCSAKHLVVHVVKEGETLTSISKKYGVSVYTIVAANQNIADIDLVYQGQRLNIPSNIQVGDRSWSANFRLPKRFTSPLSVSSEALNPKNLGVLYSNFVPPHVYPWPSQSRNIGYFLALVPLIAFCMRCIAGAIQARAAAKEFRERRATDQSVVKHHRSGGGRWRSALGDAWEPDLMDSESNQDSTELNEIHSEDQAQISHEEDTRAYVKLEDDYQKFLSQCGMSKFGYWRGGTSR